MKSRRQSSGGSAPAAAAAAGEGNYTSGGGKMERKDVEKNRRLHMKGLCLKLSSLIPATAKHHHLHYSNSSPSSNKDAVTQLDHLENAAAYITHLKERIDELKRKKEGAAHFGSSSSSGEAKPAAGVGGAVSIISMPVIEVRYQDATLDVVLISKVGEPFKLHEVITVLEQEGAEVVSASFSVIGDKIFYTIHSQALSSRIGLEASRVSQRLRDLQQSACTGT